MPQGERTLQVDEVAQRDKQRVQRLVIQPLVVIGRRAQGRSPRIAGRRAGQDCFGIVEEGVDDLAGRTGRRAGRAPWPRRPQRRMCGGAPLPSRRAERPASESGSRRRARRRAGRRRRTARKRTRAAACTSGPRPIRSASSAAEVQCEWINRDSWPRALTNSVAMMLSRCVNGWPRPTLPIRNRQYGSPAQSTR